MPELHIEKWPVERLHPYERNPRRNAGKSLENGAGRQDQYLP